MCLFLTDEPANFVEAEKELGWRTAMNEEMATIEGNDAWRVSELPPGQRAIGLKWVYKLKKDATGEVMKRKALVAKGYVHRQGVDFEEVFTPITRMETVRMLIAVATHHV
jgi:hypothetical protein